MTERILAIRLRALGDVVLVTPALRALRRGHPAAELEVVTESRYAPLLEGLDGVSRVWRLERTAGQTARLAAALRRRGYRIAVDFFGNARSALLARASGAALRVGWDSRGRKHAYHVRVPRSSGSSATREYAAAAYRRMALAAGGVDDGIDTRIALAADRRDAAARLLASIGIAGAGEAVGLVAAGSWATKTWPLAHSGALARGLLSRVPLVLLSGPGEESFAARLVALAPGLRVLPPCDAATLAAVIERLAAVVGTDSGPRHLAAALSVPSWTWFGPTHPGNWLPPGEAHGSWWTDLPCRGCDRTVCPHWNCLPGLRAEDALARVLDHLDHHVRFASALGPAAGA